MNIFTQGEPLGGVKQFDFEKGAEKWGGLSIGNLKELEEASPWIRESYERINNAIKNNEPTGWYAKVEGVDEESDE